MKSIKIGKTLKSGKGFLKALKDFGCNVTTSAESMLTAKDIVCKPTFVSVKKRTKVRLVNVSVSELGFKEGAYLENIYEKAKALGYELCPGEMGPRLGMYYKSRVKGRLYVGMESITDIFGSLRIFTIVRRDDGRLWLDGERAAGFWSGEKRFIFARRSSSKKRNR